MEPRDALYRFLFENTAVRGEIVQLDNTWRAVLERHDYPPAVRRILGELMAAAALLSATLKFSGALVMQVQSNGPVRLLVVECSADLGMRATAKWDGEIPDTATLTDLVGDGHFAITLDPGEGKKPYQGIVALEGGNIAAVLENYMRRSEQLDTRLILAADDWTASGMLLQKLPGVTEHDLDAWNRIDHLGATLKAEELLGLPVYALLRRLFGEETVRLFDPSPVCFRCSCSAERVGAMLRMMGRDEVLAVLAEKSEMEVRCEFCNQVYRYDAIDAGQLFATDIPTPAGATRH
ncbi:MAG: Hsp33 family molecular chaperone HslO [Sulfuricella sp.]|nr:Hsp33 family molecular chaperone HslO [Sulfuricella sp.]